MGGTCTAAVADLRATGLHYVVADSGDKRPLKVDWLHCPASTEEVEAARSEPYLLLGHVPYRAGLLVVDIDTDRDQPVWWWREAVEKSLGPPLCEVKTRSGGLHLYYRCDRRVGNRSWEGGDIRCAAGYAVLWDEDAVLAVLEDLSEADPVDLSRWPISQVADPGSTPHKPRPDQTARASSALRSLPCADLSYEDWLKVGMALHWGDHNGCLDDGLELWRRWSATDPARYKVGECAAKWRGFDPDGGLTLGTLFWLAERYGWKGWRRPRFSKPKGGRMGSSIPEQAPIRNAQHHVGHCKGGEQREAYRLGAAEDAGRSSRLQPQDHHTRYHPHAAVRLSAGRGAEDDPRA